MEYDIVMFFEDTETCKCYQREYTEIESEEIHSLIHRKRNAIEGLEFKFTQALITPSKGR